MPGERLQFNLRGITEVSEQSISNCTNGQLHIEMQRQALFVDKIMVLFKRLLICACKLNIWINKYDKLLYRCKLRMLK